MRIIVAEKPSLGRTIAAALKATSRHDGYIEGNGVIVTWCIGHIGQLADPANYDPALKQWSWATLPILPETFHLAISQQTKKQYNVVRKLITAKTTADVINACDAGREGELIFDLVYRLTGCKAPVLRLWTSSLTEQGILLAYQQMRPASAYHGLRDAARCRSEADWLVGINATRAQTLLMRARGTDTGKRAASVGRVQTAVLYLLWNRREAIRNFVSQPYWTLDARFSATHGEYPARWFRTDPDNNRIDRLTSEAEAAGIAQRVRGRNGTIIDLEIDERRIPTPQLYDLTALQQEMNKRHGITAEATLTAAQSLYEAKLITYPRTGSRHLTEQEANALPALLANLQQQPAYRDIVSSISTADRKKNLGKRYVDASKVEDHFALLPTGEKPGNLPTDEAHVYDRICRRLLAAFHGPRLNRVTTVTTEIAPTDRFRTAGTVCVDPGWSTIDPPTKREKDPDDGDADNTDLPPLNQGEIVQLTEITANQRKTTAPKPYTEADLLQAMKTAGRTLDDEELQEAMKDVGLGTTATRAATIEKLIRRKYVARKKKSLECTDWGADVLEAIPDEAIKSPAMTAEWEAKLNRMTRGEEKRSTFMAAIRQYTTTFVDSTRLHAAGGDTARAESLKTMPPPGKTIGTCPRCQNPLASREWQGKTYARCTHADCKVAYDTTPTGEPLHGTCKTASCNGPLRMTKKNGAICVTCDTWQN